MATTSQLQPNSAEPKYRERLLPRKKAWGAGTMHNAVRCAPQPKLGRARMQGGGCEINLAQDTAQRDWCPNPNSAEPEYRERAQVTLSLAGGSCRPPRRTLGDGSICPHTPSPISVEVPRSYPRTITYPRVSPKRPSARYTS